MTELFHHRLCGVPQLFKGILIFNAFISGLLRHFGQKAVLSFKIDTAVSLHLSLFVLDPDGFCQY